MLAGLGSRRVNWGFTFDSALGWAQNKIVFILLFVLFYRKVAEVDGSVRDKYF
jgi:hypothetical protein